MSKGIKHFLFYISYKDLYCFWLFDTYENSAKCVTLIDDSDFMDQCDNPHKYKKNADELLLEICQFIVNNGCEEEVIACDKALTQRCFGRRSAPNISVHKRWEMDDAMWKEIYGDKQKRKFEQ